MSLLQTINGPDNLRELPSERLPEIAGEIRELLIDVVSKHGGHLASSLGAVELTLALHYVYNTPIDKLVWDVGHQAYAHKIVTGRRDTFSTIRQYGGLSGFPRSSESEYDTLSVGHASTSISAALGMAIARDLQGQDHSVVAVIGDGSLSGGLALEGLNNLGMQNTGMVVVLNDNKMSIARNVGALSRYLTRVITDKRFNRLRTEIWEKLGQIDVGKRLRNLVGNLDDAVKHMVIPGKLFEDMGLRYFGPVDGHNINEMLEVFRFVKKSTCEPVLVHVVTRKGKGYSFAENDATKYHGIGKFERSTGNTTKGSAPSYSEVFGRTLMEIGREQKKVVAITAAMPDGTGLSHFRDAFPDRFFDVGIAEEHAVTFASGLARQGIKPFIALYSTFTQRCYDQLVHDVALDNLNVVLCIDRAGVVGQDGPTHHGAFDISFMRSIPNAVILSPKDGSELRDMLFTASQTEGGPIIIRYPRGTAIDVTFESPMRVLDNNIPEILIEGSEIAVVALGHAVEDAQAALAILKESHDITPTLINARFAKPLNEDFYLRLASEYSHIVTMEHNAMAGGFGSGISEMLHSHERYPRINIIGYPDEFIPHGSMEQLKKDLGFTPEKLAQRIYQFVTSNDDARVYAD